MALSVGGSSWVSISQSSSSSSLRRYPKPTLFRLIQGQRHELRQLKIVEEVGKPNLFTHGGFIANQKFSRRGLVAVSTSEDQSVQNELNVDDLEQEKLHSVVDKEDTSKSSTFLPIERAEGKPGFVSFHGVPYQRQDETAASGPSNEPSNFFWFIGPSVLVASLVFPSLYLRRILSAVFEDSLLADFLILFFTEALFYSGVAIFILLIDHVYIPTRSLSAMTRGRPKMQLGLRLSSVATLILSLLIPLVTMGMVWPWTGPAASATLAPYLVGLVVEFAFEQYARFRRSTAWPVIPVIFQVYRLHQLNRAAQLVTALSFSVRGAESTSQTVAINNSLGTLLNVLQLLGVICIWSLSSFLMRFLPSSPIIPDP